MRGGALPMEKSLYYDDDFHAARSIRRAVDDPSTRR
jgi:hypothetical protein